MATEKRLIDVNALLSIMREENKKFPDLPWSMTGVRRLMEKLPTVDAAEVVHGYWDDSGRYQFPSGEKAIRCSICGCGLSEGEYHLYNWNYCPVCGAKMDGERRTDNA